MLLSGMHHTAKAQIGPGHFDQLTSGMQCPCYFLVLIELLELGLLGNGFLQANCPSDFLKQSDLKSLIAITI